eukprot:scaffold5937_cov275-Pinguiococcus_pyrenoidosus.AAC.10
MTLPKLLSSLTTRVSPPAICMHVSLSGGWSDIRSVADQSSSRNPRPSSSKLDAKSDPTG